MKKKKLIVVGDRVLISADEAKERTDTGLYLPQGLIEREKVQGGYVVKTGPGYPMPDLTSMDEEPWATHKREPKFLSLEAEIGDYAIFLRKASIEIEFEGKKYLIVPESAILVLVRDDLLSEEL
jgi:co-chaperonin GroES (HSP10)